MPSLGPAAHDHGEVLDVARDEHSFFFCRERQQLFVSERCPTCAPRQRPGRRDLRSRSGTATLCAEMCASRKSLTKCLAPAQTGFEGTEMNGIFLFELLYRPPVFGDYGVDLLGEHLVVVAAPAGSGAHWRTNLRPCAPPSRCPCRCRRSATRRARSPSPTLAAPSRLPMNADPREQPHPQRLLGECLDDCALAAAGALCLAARRASPSGLDRRMLNGADLGATTDIVLQQLRRLYPPGAIPR